MPALTHNLHAAPNPFNPSTRFSFELGSESSVDLRVFDLSGRLVKVLLDSEVRQPGSYSVTWNGHNNRGESLPSGMYFCRLKSGGITETVRVSLIK